MLGSNRRDSEIWAICAYFNPVGFKRRLLNYRLFRQHLQIPLATVELAYGPHFELEEGDADILVRKRGRDVMWQKERLLNLALEALPPTCTKVAWLDCDLIFMSPDWPERTSRHLDQVALVQPFGLVHRMPRHWRPGDPVDDADVVSSNGYAIEAGLPVDDCLRSNGEAVRCMRGMAWAARRELLARHGFYDASVIGGGDALMFRAAFGYFDEAANRACLSGRGVEHYRAWAEPFHDEVRGSVGHVAGDAIHLWHGELSSRRYVKRFDQFSAFAFDPASDIALEENGAWRWSSAKAEMHAFVRDYFDERREDG